MKKPGTLDRLPDLCALPRRLQIPPEEPQHLGITPSRQKYQPSEGPMRAAKQIERNSSFLESTDELIDRERVCESW
jgi:hypothetical protein